MTRNVLDNDGDRRIAMIQDGRWVSVSAGICRLEGRENGMSPNGTQCSGEFLKGGVLMDAETREVYWPHGVDIAAAQAASTADCLKTAQEGHLREMGNLRAGLTPMGRPIVNPDEKLTIEEVVAICDVHGIPVEDGEDAREVLALVMAARRKEATL